MFSFFVGGCFHFCNFFKRGVGLLAMNHDNCSKPGFTQPGDHRQAADREYSFEVMILGERDFCDFGDFLDFKGETSVISGRRSLESQVPHVRVFFASIWN